MDPVFETRDVNPAFARSLLESNIGNRSKKFHKIREYADDMRSGRWRLNGETIKIATDGRILDGQNRLEAVLLADTKVRMSFALEIHDEAQQTMDSGSKRNVADKLKFRGVEVNGQKAGVIATGMLVYQNVSAISDTRQIEFVESHISEIARAIEISSTAMKELGSQKLFGTAAMILDSVDAEHAETFMQLLGTGEMLARGNPILTLRNKFLTMERITVNSRGGMMNNLALVFKAWNAWRDGKSMRVIRFGENETFPIPR